MDHHFEARAARQQFSFWLSEPGNPRLDASLPHKCGVPRLAGTPHLCGRASKMRIAGAVEHLKDLRLGIGLEPATPGVRLLEKIEAMSGQPMPAKRRCMFLGS